MAVSSYLLWSIYAIGIAYFFKRIYELYKVRRKLSKIDGPKGYPIIGPLLDWMVPHEDLLSVYSSWCRKYKHLDLIKVHIFRLSFVIPLNIRLYEDLLPSKEHISKPKEYKILEPLLGKGLITSTGDKWHNRRKMLTPAFNGAILKEYINIFNQQSLTLVKKLNENSAKSPFDIYPYLTRCALDIIFESAMGRNVNTQEDMDSNLAKALLSYKEVTQNRLIYPWLWNDYLFALSSTGRKHNKLVKIIDGFINQVIEEKKVEYLLKQNSLSNTKTEGVDGKKKRKVFIDILLEASENGVKLTNKDLREEVNTFMLTGHETSATSLSWTLYLLGHYPEIQKKVQEELEEVIGSDVDFFVSSDNLAKLKYLDCVIKETLRLYPPAPFAGRKIEKDCKLGGYDIPAGVTVVLSFYTMHRNEEIFPNPEDFIPERFQPENKNKCGPYHYMPFSAGPRNCIGQKFANMELKVVLAHVLHSFNIESILPREEMKCVYEVTLTSKDGFVLKLTPRKL